MKLFPILCIVLAVGPLACTAREPTAPLPDVERTTERLTVPPVSAEIVECGEIEAIKPIDTTKAPDTGLGYVSVMQELERPKFKPGCPKVKAKLGTRFGIEVLVSSPGGQSIVALKTRVTHPAMRNPQTGPVTTVDQWESPMNAGIPRYAGWSFDKPWELVSGAWRMEILEADRVIASQDFAVTVAGH